MYKKLLKNYFIVYKYIKMCNCTQNDNDSSQFSFSQQSNTTDCKCKCSCGKSDKNSTGSKNASNANPIVKARSLGLPSAKLGKSLGFNQARRSGADEVSRNAGSRSYGSFA